jgi:hypothetical protein
VNDLYNPDETKTEPLVSVGTITAAGAALLALVAAFGLRLNDDQQAAVLGILAVVAPIIVAWWGRRKVYSPSTVAKLLRR